MYRWTLLWTLFILILTFMPGKALPPQEFKIPYLDKMVHFSFYGVFIILYMWESAKHLTNYGKWPGFFFAIGLGILTEYGQLFAHSGRSFEWGDMAANLTGACCGLLWSTFFLNKL